MPLDIDKLNAVGTQDLPPQDSPPAKRTPQQEIDDAFRAIWDVKMPDESEAFQRVAQHMKPVVIECFNERQLKTTKMRFYRAKNLLMKRNNKYVERMVISIKGTKLTISLKQAYTYVEEN